eukprot:4635326-Prymnesium_polylepis.1
MSMAAALVAGGAPDWQIRLGANWQGLGAHFWRRPSCRAPPRWRWPGCPCVAPPRMPCRQPASTGTTR